MGFAEDFGHCMGFAEHFGHRRIAVTFLNYVLLFLFFLIRTRMHFPSKIKIDKALS